MSLTISLGNQLVVKVSLENNLPDPAFFQKFVNFRFVTAGIHHNRDAARVAFDAMSTTDQYKEMLVEHNVEKQSFTVIKPFVAVKKTLFVHFYELFPKAEPSDT